MLVGNRPLSLQAHTKKVADVKCCIATKEEVLHSINLLAGNEPLSLQAHTKKVADVKGRIAAKEEVLHSITWQALAFEQHHLLCRANSLE